MGDPGSQGEADWPRLAMDTRTALDLLGDSPPLCLLGGDGVGCHTDAQHAAGNLGALRALVQDLILRLRPEDAAAVWEGHRRTDAALHGGHRARQRPPGAPPGRAPRNPPGGTSQDSGGPLRRPPRRPGRRAAGIGAARGAATPAPSAARPILPGRGPLTGTEPPGRTRWPSGYPNCSAAWDLTRI